MEHAGVKLATEFNGFSEDRFLQNRKGHGDVHCRARQPCLMQSRENDVADDAGDKRRQDVRHRWALQEWLCFVFSVARFLFVNSAFRACDFVFAFVYCRPASVAQQRNNEPVGRLEVVIYLRQINMSCAAPRVEDQTSRRKRKHDTTASAKKNAAAQPCVAGEEVPVDVRVLVLERLRSMMQTGNRNDSCFGRPVDVLTPRDLGVFAETAARMREAGNSFLGVAVAPKFDGERLLMVGVRNSAAELGVYFVAPCGQRVFSAGRVLLNPPATASAHAFVLDGEFRQPAGNDVGDGGAHDGARRKATFATHDVLSYKDHRTDSLGFFGRLKFAVPILHMLSSGRIVRCEHAPQVAVVLKPVFDFGAAMHVLAQCNAGKFGETDGLVLTDALHPRAPSMKYKPDVTVDFQLVDGHRLCVQGDGANELLFVSNIDPRDVTPQLAFGGPCVLECRLERCAPCDTAPDPTDGELFRISAACKGKWRVVKHRPDKTAANHVSVFERNCLLIGHALAPADLAAASAEAKKATIAPYYAPALAVPRRLQATARMRGFHSTVKSALYADMLAGARAMLELGCGRGADVGRVVRFGRSLDRVVVTDIDERGLLEYERRWRTLVPEARDRGAKLTVAPHGDCNDAAFRQALQTRYPKYFDCVSAQFCVHYFHENAPALVSAVMADGGRFACTLFDGTQVLAALQKNGGRLSWRDNESGAVHASIELTDARGHPLSSVESTRAVAGTHVAVFVDSIGNRIVEPLVDIDDFVQRMKTVGMECTRRESFAAFPSDFFLAEAEPLFELSALYCALMFEKVAVSS